MLDLLGVSLVSGSIAWKVDAVGVVEHHVRACEVAGDVDEHGSRSAGRGYIERFSERFGQIVGGLQQEAMLDHGHGDAHDVGFLERIGAYNAARDLAADHDQRDRIHVCSGYSRDGIRSARAAGDQHNAHFAGCARVAVCHMRGALLVAREHVANFPAVVEGVVNLNGLTARITEDGIDSLCFERGYDGLRAGHDGALLIGVAARAERLARYGARFAGKLVVLGFWFHGRCAPLSARPREPRALIEGSHGPARMGRLARPVLHLSNGADYRAVLRGGCRYRALFR